MIPSWIRDKNINSRMELFIKVNGLDPVDKVMEFKYGQMVLSM